MAQPKYNRLVLLVAAAGEVIPALVASKNNDGTLNLVHITSDASKHPLLGSADFHHAIERKFGIPYGLDKFNELQTFKNEQAEAKNVDAKIVDLHDVLANTHDVWVTEDEVNVTNDQDGVPRVTGFYFAADAVAPYKAPPPERPVLTTGNPNASSGSGPDAA